MHHAKGGLVLAALALAACGPRAAQSTPGTAAVAAAAAAAPVPADVRFMQQMIPHHAQALVMTALVPERTRSRDILLLAERIERSQADEIAQMQHWLRRRGAEVPAADAHHHAAMGHGELMPGMLTGAQLDSLGQARGTGFDRLFLRYMISHHEGALRMVAELFAAPGKHDAELFNFASDVDADQRAEIRRMHTMLRERQ